MELNQIVMRSLSELHTQTACEAAEMITYYESLLLEARFAASSKPEREDAICRLEYALDNVQMTEKPRKIIELLCQILKVEDE